MEEIEDSLAKNKSKKNRVAIGWVAIGIFFMGIGFFFNRSSPEKEAYMYIFIYGSYVIGFQIFITQFEYYLKKYVITKYFYWFTQVVFGLILLSGKGIIMLGKVFSAIIFVFTTSAFLLLKTLEYMDVNNNFEISLFLSITLISITFSFKGNSIVNWIARITETGSDERLERDLKIINKYLGQTQIKFFIYCLYFICIITFTVINLSNPDPGTKQNTYLVIQSFGALVAFDRILNNKKIMEPWTSKIKEIAGVWKEIRKTPLKEIFKEEEEEIEGQN